ncbi:ankyrin repeat-containing domain protein [Aspergillus spectabilis]
MSLPQAVEKRTALHNLAEHGDHSLLRSLLAKIKPKKRPVDLIIFDHDGQTPLSVAAEHGHLPIVKLLTRQRDTKTQVDINALNLDGQTPLHLAAGNGYTLVVDFLLRHSDITHHKQTDYFGRSPIFCAVINGYEEVPRLLEYKHADVNAFYELELDSELDSELAPNSNNGSYYGYTSRSHTLLSLASLHGHHRIVTLLTLKYILRPCRMRICSTKRPRRYSAQFTNIPPRPSRQCIPP